MFESFSAADRRGRAPTAVPLLGSLVVHLALAMVLFTIAITEAGLVAHPLAGRRVVTLLEPVPTPVRITAPVRMTAPVRAEIAPEHTSIPRLFRPAVPAASAVPAATVPSPAIDIPRSLLPAVELRPLPVVPAPPLKTDNLPAAWVMTQVAPPSGQEPAATVQLAGFAAAQSAAMQTHGFLRQSRFANAPAADAALRGSTPPLSRGGFGDAVVLDSASRPPRTAPIAGDGPTVARAVEILSKPKPGYSEEARRLQIEGEVLLEVLFSASGQVHVLRTVRGLGHGLDESAIAAAEAIRFRPAERGRITADSTAIVHIVFQLAY